MYLPFILKIELKLTIFLDFLMIEVYVTQKSIIKYNVEAIELSFVEVEKDRNDTFTGVKTTSPKRSLSSRFF